MSIAIWPARAGTGESFVVQRIDDHAWRVRGPGDRCGGVFASYDAALHFIRQEEDAGHPTRYRPPSPVLSEALSSHRAG